MDEEREWTVEIRLAYTVRSGSADAALGAVLPLVSLGRDRYGPQPEVADYTVRERAIAAPIPAPVSGAEELHGLTKPMYTAKEIAAILNLSVATVYQRIPGMRIGDARRYSRATVLDVIQNGVAMEPRPEAPQRVQYERRGRVKHLPRVVAKRPEKIESPTLTIKEAGKLLHLSPSKVRQLLEQRRIYHVREYGKTTIPRDALQFFIDGQSPRDFVEKLITYARNNPSWQKDINLLEEAAAKMRAEWSE